MSLPEGISTAFVEVGTASKAEAVVAVVGPGVEPGAVVIRPVAPKANVNPFCLWGLLEL